MASDYVDNDTCPVAVPYGHAWVGGGMIVADEDVAYVAETRDVTCERCDYIYESDSWIAPNAGSAS